MPPEFLPTHHRSLRLQNFTAFGDATFEFVPGVNVLVGENGTGKTHAMKILYGRYEPARFDSIPFSLDAVLGIEDAEENVIRRPSRSATVEGALGSDEWNIQFDDFSGVSLSGSLSEGPPPVFIPAMDMIGHSRGFLAAQNLVQLDFDRTFDDIVSRLEIPSRRIVDRLAQVEMGSIQDRMGGTVEYDAGDRRFYLVTPEGRTAMPLVAEGLRKFATLHTIWKNGWLRTGTCLFWDEPEANLNPKLMDEAVAAILALSRGGVQVFLATHSYVILKELEVQATKDDSVRFFALQKTEEGTVVHPADRYLDLKPNPIEDQYASLFDRTIEKRLREQAERV